MKGAMEAITYYDLRSEPLRFYLVDEFVATEVEKTSPRGMRGHQYLNLAEVAGDDFQNRKGYTSAELAGLLRGKIIA